MLVKSIYADDYIVIITTLRKIRESLYITQEDLAHKLHTRQSFISKVESRERRLDVIEFLSWIDALGITVEDVLPPKYLKKETE